MEEFLQALAVAGLVASIAAQGDAIMRREIEIAGQAHPSPLSRVREAGATIHPPVAPASARSHEIQAGSR